MKLALAMIVRGTNDEAELLQRCLENLSPYVDGIFITRTHKKGEKPNAAVGNVAINFGATLSDFEWIDDFAAARNFNFKQVPKEFDYIMWTDADDMWRGLEKLRPTIESHEFADAFGFWYLYDWDEFKKPVVVHRKTMIIKNDGAAEWRSALHEDLQELRQLDVQLVEGIQRLHLTNDKRIDENAKRNVGIAAKDVTDNPNDPRSYWNLGNAQYGVSDFEGARDSFTKFLAISESDEEKYVIHERLADVYKGLGDQEAAAQQLQIAIGLSPSLPDAYLQLAFLYNTFGDLDRAEHYALQGIVKRPQTMKLIHFNPRDYDYNPMMLLAKIYYQKNRPDLMLPLLKGCLKIYPEDKHLKKMVRDGEKEYKAMAKALTQVQKLSKIVDKEKLRKELEKLPDDIQSHPAVAVLRNTHFVKQSSSGKDLVIYCGNTAHQWNPELFETKGFGGSEEAVFHMARELSLLGWNVTVYNNCGHKEIKQRIVGHTSPTIKDGEKSELVNYVTWKPFWMWNYRDKQDVVILWRWTKPLDADINAPKVFVDLHDVVPQGEFTEKRLAKLTKVFVKTEFHRSLFPNVPDSKIAIVPNGFATYPDKKVEKDPYLIINTSSPDRSMDVLPKLFKEIKKQVPQAKMAWAYGWHNFQSMYAHDPKKLKWMGEVNAAMEEAGVENLGRLTQEQVGELYWKAAIFAYPTEFAEIDCISVKKAQAARALPITTDFGALKESNAFGITVHSEKTKDNWNQPYQFHFGLESEEAQKQWVKEVVSALKMKKKVGTTDDWIQSFSWPQIAKRWSVVLTSPSA